MHSTSQDHRCEGGDAEVFSSLRLAGFDGRCMAILDESRLTLERRSGHTLNLKHDAVARLRHHTTPLIPRWLFGVAVFLIYAAYRVFIPPAQYWFFSVGAVIILIWAMGRRPTLTIDTNNGDCHTLYGNDASLMRLTALMQRLQDGQSLEEAKEGLTFLSRDADYPTTKALEDRIIADAAPEPVIANQAIASILGEESEQEGNDLPPEWLGVAVGASVVAGEAEHNERAVEPLAFQRARQVHGEMAFNRLDTDQVHDPWAMAGVKPLPDNDWTQPCDPQHRGQSSPSMGEGFSMFGEGGLFGEPAKQEIPPQQQVSRYHPPVMHKTGLALPQHGNDDFSRTPGDSMLRDGLQSSTVQAQSAFLPSFLGPLDGDDPERDLIKVEPQMFEAEVVQSEPPALVAAAQVGEAGVFSTEKDGKVRFPHMQKLMRQRKSGRFRRLRLHSRALRRENPRGIRGMILPSLGLLAKVPKRLLSRGQSVFRTPELLRIEALRNKDAMLIKQIKDMADSEKGIVAADVERMLKKHHVGLLLGDDVPDKFSELSSTSDSTIVGVAGLPRLDLKD